MGYALILLGRSDEAIPHFDQAIRLSPNDTQRWSFEQMKGVAFWYLGQTEDALAYAVSACRHPNTVFWPFTSVAAALVELDRMDEAKKALAEAVRRQPELTITAMRGMYPWPETARAELFLENMRKAGLPE